MFASLTLSTWLLAALDPAQSPVAALLAACLIGGAVLGLTGAGGDGSVRAGGAGGPDQPAWVRDAAAIAVFVALSVVGMVVGMSWWHR